ncbi:MAG: hypothetical protein HY023_01640 [Chloroflexi bacterium]|nr:hypothetical protein [Chloroflexota bacterium]
MAYQYFQDGRLESNSSASADALVRLSPLGREFASVDPPSSNSYPDALCFAETGHCVRFSFRKYFEQHGGASFFGYPITDLKAEEGRLVQHFERATLVWDKSLPPESQLRLAPLGILKCSLDGCTAINSTTRAIPGSVESASVAEVESLFAAYTARHGGVAVFGMSLAAPQPGTDGNMEQPYDNAIMFVDASAPEGVGLRPLGAARHRREPAVPATDPRGLYDPVSGHNVLHAFRRFYEQYGGQAVFGHPISEMRADGAMLVQDFENARLEWHPDAPEDSRMCLTAYGREALLGSGPTNTPVAQTPAITAWEEWPIIFAGQPQTLHARVVDEKGRPLQGAIVTAMVRSAENVVDYTLPSTDANGHTSITFALSTWNPGQLVQFDMWATYAGRTGPSAMGSFVQWYGAAPTSTPGP